MIHRSHTITPIYMLVYVSNDIHSILSPSRWVWLLLIENYIHVYQSSPQTLPSHEEKRSHHYSNSLTVSSCNLVNKSNFLGQRTLLQQCNLATFQTCGQPTQKKDGYSNGDEKICSMVLWQLCSKIFAGPYNIDCFQRVNTERGVTSHMVWWCHLMSGTKAGITYNGLFHKARVCKWSQV